MVERARIVLAAAAAVNNADIADDLAIALNTVVKWRKRFFEEGSAGLADRKRSGRPTRFSPSGSGRSLVGHCPYPGLRAASLTGQSPGSGTLHGGCVRIWQ
jgi:hypothetical protein